MNFRSVLTAVAIIFLLAPCKSVAQPETDPFTEQVISAVADQFPEDFDFTECYDRIMQYRKNPIDINKTDGQELKDLLFLTPVQVNALLDHRKTCGDFIDLLELQSIDVLGLQEIRMLLPFIVIRPSLLDTRGMMQRHTGSSGQDILVRYGQVMEKQAGYRQEQAGTPTGYSGSPAKISLRYHYHYNQQLGLSVTLEKDPGESLSGKVWKPRVDFSSANIAYSGRGLIRKIVAGSYSLQFGQGLCMWSGLSLGKGGAIAMIPRQGTGLTPYASSSPATALRGFALSAAAGRFSFTPFISHARKDASIEEDPATGRKEVTSVDETGLHRTLNELSKQDKLHEAIYGAAFRYTSQKLAAGMVVFNTHFNYPFRPGEQPADAADFSGSRLLDLSAYYNYNFRNAYLFGEVAHGWKNNGTGLISGLIASLSPGVGIVLLYRDYQRNYHSFFNQAIAGGTGLNERGWYTGISITPSPKIQWELYADQYQFPWLRYRADAPSHGNEFRSQFTYTSGKRVKLLFNYRYRMQQENDADDHPINILQDVQQQNLRLEADTKISSKTTLRSRIELVKYEKEGPAEPGMLMYQDLLYHPLSSKISGNLRFSVFDSRSYNSRIYAFENDVLYSYSNPAFQDAGIRFYINTCYSLSREATIWLRYARTDYLNKTTIGSGPEQINGPVKSDIKVQLRLVL